MTAVNGNGHVAPQAIEAEQAALGAVLLSDTALPALIDEGLRAEDFYRGDHGRIYAAMLELHSLGEPVDALTLVERLKLSGALDEVGGRAAIDLLAGSVPAVGNVRAYVGSVRETALQRRRVTAAYRVLEDPSSAAALQDLRELVEDAPSAGGRRLRVLSTEEMLTTDPPPVEWLVEGVVARGTLTMLAGREKEGKSLLCLCLATTVASGGGTVAGITCHPGRALVVDAENGPAAIHGRVRALGLSLEDADHLVLAEARNFDLKRDLGLLERLLDDVRPDFLVLDSWRSLWGGQENDSDEVAACLDPLRELVRSRAVAAVLIHHMSRAGAYRGSTAAGASVENLLDFSRLDDDPDRRRRRLRNTGCRYAEEAPVRWLSVEADRKLGLVLVDEVEPFGETSEDEQLPSVRRRPVTDKLIPDVERQLSEEPKMLKEIAIAIGRDEKDKTVRRILQGLEEAGRARQTKDGWQLPSATNTPAKIPLYSVGGTVAEWQNPRDVPPVPPATTGGGNFGGGGNNGMPPATGDDGETLEDVLLDPELAEELRASVNGIWEDPPDG